MALDINLEKKQPTGKFPDSIKYIVGNEAAERFNYYGLRAILTTFLISQFYNPSGSTDPAIVQEAEAIANAKTHDFVAMVYLLPLIGGMVADWFLGKYRTILYLSLVYAAGNILLATSVNNEQIFLSALMLIALGAGGIKPCVSANVGDQFDESNQHMMSKAFDAFYASINAGSVLSILLIPYLKRHYGAQVAFGVPAIAMLVAVFFFWAGRTKYRKVPAPVFNQNKLVVFLTTAISLLICYIIFDKILHKGTGPLLGAWAASIVVLALIFKKWWFAKPSNFVGINLFALMNGGFDAAKKEYGEETVEGIKSVWRVMAVFAFVPVFWALWDQSQSEWVVQATKMDLKWLGIEWQAEQISFVNAVFVLIFIPVFSFGIFPAVEKMGIKVTPLRKIGAGLVLTALSFVLVAIIQGWIDAGERPNISWQIYAFVILTAAEVLVSITCLEYAYTQAPHSMKSTIMACYLLTVTLGNVLVSVIQNNIKDGGFFAQYHGAQFFWLFCGICAATAVLFMIISPKIKERSYVGQ